MKNPKEVKAPPFPDLLAALDQYDPRLSAEVRALLAELRRVIAETGAATGGEGLSETAVTTIKDIATAHVGSAMYNQLSLQYSAGLPLNKGGEKRGVILRAMEKANPWFSAARFKGMDGRLLKKPSGQANLRARGRAAAKARELPRVDIDELTEREGDAIYAELKAEDQARLAAGKRPRKSVEIQRQAEVRAARRLKERGQ